MINYKGFLKQGSMIMVCLLLSFAIEADPERIQRLITQGDLDTALRLTNEALEQDGEHVSYRFLKGLILTRLERLEEARDIFLDIIRSNPELPEPYNNLAVIYAAMGDYDSARQALEDAINTHPSYATAHENMGDIYAKLASQAYIQALELDSGNVAAKTKLALVNELFSTPEPEQPVTPDGAGPAAVPAEALPSAVRSEAATARPEPEITRPKPAASHTNEAKQADQRQQPAVTMQPEQPAPVPTDRRAGIAPMDEQQVISAVKQSVLDWAKAWSGQEVDLYLSFYASDFTPQGGLNLGQWQQLRRQRLSNPDSIEVTISDLVVEMLGRDHAQATFTQRYQSDIYSDRVKKTLLMKREGGRWLITQEQSG